MEVITEPAALPASSHILATIRKYLAKGVSLAYKPLSFILWGLCILGLDPFDVWLNTTFILFYITSLFEKGTQPPQLYYGMFDQLRFMVFDWDLASSGEEFAMANLRILALVGIMVAWHEIVVRFLLKNKYLFPIAQVQLFTYIFTNRFLSYVGTFIAFESVIVYYSYSVISLQPSTQSLLVVLGLFACSFLTLVLLVFQARRILLVKSFRKFYLLLLASKWLAILIGIDAQTSFPYFLDMMMPVLVICLICIFLDEYPEELC